MKKRKFPRRNIIHASPSGGWSINLFHCKLECGHFAAAYGRRPKGSDIFAAQEPPKTCECRECGKDPQP